jgi:pentatricopeptide repeat protein
MPDDSTIAEHLADSYLKLDRIEKAVEFYERALKLDLQPDQKERLQKKIKGLKEKQSK